MAIMNQEECSQYSIGTEKLVYYTCDTCGVTKSRKWNMHRRSALKAGRDAITGQTFCKDCAVRQSVGTRKYSKPYSKCGYGPKTGADHTSWKGGTFIGSDGYKMVYTGNNTNVKSKWENYRKEHFIVAEEKIGRPLRTGEVVHHIDCDKLNNAPENLLILESEAEHRRIHNQLNEVTTLLLRARLIVFDGEKYVAVDKFCELLEHPESLEN